MRVLDLCAGRGIKATALADLGAEVLAIDRAAPDLAQPGVVARKEHPVAMPLGTGLGRWQCQSLPVAASLGIHPDNPCTAPSVPLPPGQVIPMATEQPGPIGPFVQPGHVSQGQGGGLPAGHRHLVGFQQVASGLAQGRAEADLLAIWTPA